MRKVESMVLVQPGEEKVKGGANITADFSYLMGGGREKTLFRHVQQKDKRQQVSAVAMGILTEEKRKRHSEAVREGRVLEWMTRKAVEPQFLEILTWTRRATESDLQVNGAFSKG